MAKHSGLKRRFIEREAEDCAVIVFQEITGGSVRREAWYLWFLCERHGGAPLVDGRMPSGQLAYWDGEDIVVDGRAHIEQIAAALPEELTHRLTSRETPRFEPINYDLRFAPAMDRAAFQEMVGQRVAELFRTRS